MEKYPEEFNRFLQTDLKTAIKIQDNPVYYDKLLKADGYVKSLKIMSEIQFYAYALVLEELKGISYKDMQAFQRFKCQEYYIEVQNRLSNNKPKIKRIK